MRISIKSRWFQPGINSYLFNCDSCVSSSRNLSGHLSLNVEHRTSNIEHRILMTLRFIYFKTSQPQPATSPSVVRPGSNDSPRRAQGLGLSKAAKSKGRFAFFSLFLNWPFDTKAHDRQNTLFDVGRSMFDVRCSFF
jgi:hypothetical protein